MSANAIEIRGLTKSFPKFKLGPLDLTVPRGAVYGFIGPNGAGKTTTIDLLLGMGHKDGGQIEVLGLDHERQAVAMKQEIGYVSPDLNFQAWGKIGKALQFVRGFYPTWDEQYCAQLMTVLGLRLEDRIATLSFGSRIKLSLLLALAHRPKVLILDEPTVGLDAVSKQQLFSELLSIVKEGERTVFISSHGLTDIERFADHIGMIKEGRLLLEGSMDEVVGRYRMIDFEVRQGEAMEGIRGLRVVLRDADRCRALVDQREWQAGAGLSPGFKEIANAPVTLEELFVSLAKN